MKYIISSIVVSIAVLFSACGNENMALEDTNISAASGAPVSISLAGQPICTKSMPPECSVDGKKIKTSKLGVPERDAAGNFIFE